MLQPIDLKCILTLSTSTAHLVAKACIWDTQVAGLHDTEQLGKLDGMDSWLNFCSSSWDAWHHIGPDRPISPSELTPSLQGPGEEA